MRDDLNGKPLDNVQINGRSFLHISGGEVGLCHQTSSNIYETFSEGRCYLFQSAIHTLCPGVVDGTRELTSAESKALARQLDLIIQSVKIAPVHK
jgi:hypothetical protein